MTVATELIADTDTFAGAIALESDDAEERSRRFATMTRDLQVVLGEACGPIDPLG
jgi:hypothetical protein